MIKEIRDFIHENALWSSGSADYLIKLLESDIPLPWFEPQPTAFRYLNQKDETWQCELNLKLIEHLENEGLWPLPEAPFKGISATKILQAMKTLRNSTRRNLSPQELAQLPWEEGVPYYPLWQKVYKHKDTLDRIDFGDTDGRTGLRFWCIY